MKQRTHITLVAALLAVSLLTACRDEEKTTLNFNARIEQLDNDGAKTLLTGERWIYWYEWDAISINSDCSGSSTPAEGLLLNHGSSNYPEYNAVFQSTLEWGSKYFCALYPYSTSNIINASGEGSSTFSQVSISLPDAQPYTSDTSFAHNVMPMVAWYGGTTTSEPYTSPNLDFHSLGGIVRLQIYNPLGINDMKINSIVISSDGRDNKQLKGMFNVANYKTFDPHLTATTSAEADRSITITTPSGGIDFPQNSLVTFYLVLPALKGMDDSTVYSLKMTINSTAGSCTKNFTVPIRRNGITYMRALGIDNWSNGAAETGLVGNGTQARPFKIYTVADLKYVRAAFHTNPVIINGQEVTRDTWFRIMTSSIVLTESNWTNRDGGGFWSTGIENFKGHMTYYGTNSSNPVIVNNSSLPLFQTITSDGEIDGINVNCDTSISVSTGSYTPFCVTNRGTMRNCRVMSNITTGTHSHTINVNTPAGSGTTTVAGICLTNTGTITGSGCVARFDAERCDVAGICYNNQGTITGCYVSAPTTVLRADNVAGICYLNTVDGTVRDSYFATVISGTTYNCGGIVFDNKGLVEHCYLGEAATINTSGSVGGIVNTNTGDDASCKVNYCYADGALTGSTVGLIAATVSNGRILNSFCNNSLTIVTLKANDDQHYGGGLVGELNGGTIENSFIYDNKIRRIDNKGIIGGLIGKLNAGTVNNCYVYESNTTTHSLFGTKSNGATITDCHIVQGSGTESGISNWATDQFTDLQSGLNSHKPVDGMSWEGAVNSATPPHLEAYTVTSSKTRRH